MNPRACVSLHVDVNMYTRIAKIIRSYFVNWSPIMHTTTAEINDADGRIDIVTLARTSRHSSRRPTLTPSAQTP
jgi:hypothetical protein